MDKYNDKYGRNKIKRKRREYHMTQIDNLSPEALASLQRAINLSAREPRSPSVADQVAARLFREPAINYLELRTALPVPGRPHRRPQTQNTPEFTRVFGG